MKIDRLARVSGRFFSAPVFFLGVTLLYFLPMLSSRNIFVERDLAAFFIPPRYLWVSMVKSFELPLWNPHNYSGIPLLATLQPGIFYPPHLLYLILPFNVAWNWVIILHFFFSGLATYTLLRYLRVSKAGAIVGATIFMLSGYLISIHNLLTHLLAVPWFPLVIVSFLKYFETANIKHIIICSILLAIQFFAGAPEISIVTVMALCALTVDPRYFLPLHSPPIPSLPKRARAWGVTIVLFLLLSSIQLLPFLELKAHSIRAGGLSYPEAITWSFAWRDFIQFFVPDAFGYFTSSKKYWSNQSWLLTLYWGITPFVLSSFYFVSGDRKWPVFVSLMAVCLILALGGNTPLYRILYHVPPFNSIRYPVKFIFLFIFLVSLTAGLGFDAVRKGISDGSRRVQRLVSFFFYFGFVFVILWGLFNLYGKAVARFFESMGLVPESYNEPAINIHNIKRFLLFSFSFCTMLLVFMRTRFKKAASFALALLVGLDIFLANMGYYTSGSWKFYIDTNKWGEHTFLGKMSSAGETERYFVTFKTLGEFNHFPYDRAILAPPYAGIFGLYAFGGAEVLRINNYEMFSNLLKDSPTIEAGKKYLDVSGVRYVISAFQVDDKDFELLHSLEAGQKKAYLYAYKRFRGRFLLYGKIRMAKDHREALAMIRDPSLDLTKELVIIAKEPLNPDTGALDGEVKLVSYRANALSLRCRTNRDSFLYVSDVHYPGWKAYVNSNQVALHQANLAFRAVLVPAGTHTVSFVYRPMSFSVGCFLTTLGVLLSLFLFLWGNRRRKIHG